MRSIVLLLVGLNYAAPIRAETDEARFLAGLRERQLYQVAEDYGAEQWRRDDLSDGARAELAIQLALVYTDQALASPPESRDSLWAKADGACAALIEGWPNNPRRRLVEVQRALVLLARGEHERQPTGGQAIEHLRAASRRLTEVAEGVGRELIELRLHPPLRPPAEALSIQELESLEANISFHLARAERQIGLCYPRGTADRDDALLQAVKRLTPIARQTPPDELVWDARIELAACQRELGQTASAGKLISAWLIENPPPGVAARLSEGDRPLSPLGRNGVAESRQQVDEHFAATLNAAATERAAGRFAAAAEQFRALALRQPEHPQAAEAHRLAILCTTDLLREVAPADRESFAKAYESLLHEHLARWPTGDSADDVRLWLGQLLAGRRDWPAAIGVLQQARPTADRFAESVKLLVDCYDHQLRQLENQNAADVQERNQLVAAATQFLQPIITGPDNRWPDPWSEVQRETATALARLHLRYADQSSPYAERLLVAALRGAPAVVDTEKGGAWQTDARSLLIGALARNGKTAEAQAIVVQLVPGQPDSLMETLAGIDRIMTRVSPAERGDERELGQIALAIVRLLDAQPDKLDAGELSKLRAYRAAALAAVGDRPAALAQYAELAAESARQELDGDLQERYATLLAASDSAAELQQALARWQEVETRSRRGGPRWRRARSARIELLRRLGNQAEAEKLIRLTRLLYPDWNAATAQ